MNCNNETPLDLLWNILKDTVGCIFWGAMFGAYAAGGVGAVMFGMFGFIIAIAFVFHRLEEGEFKFK